MEGQGRVHHDCDARAVPHGRRKRRNEQVDQVPDASRPVVQMSVASRPEWARPAAGAAITWLTAIAVFAQAPPASVKNPIAASAESVAVGKQSYTRLCAPCHGISGEGGAGNDLIPASPDL